MSVDRLIIALLLFAAILYVGISIHPLFLLFLLVLILFFL